MRLQILTSGVILVLLTPTRAPAQNGLLDGEAEAEVSPDPQPSSPEPGWSLAAAIVGFSTAGVTLALGIVADALLESEPGGASLALELTSVIAIGALNPVIFAGGRSARRQGEVTGCRGCRVAAWVLFAVHAVAAITTISLGFALDDPLPHGLVGSMVGLGSLSNALFAVDALSSRSEALREVTAR